MSSQPGPIAPCPLDANDPILTLRDGPFQQALMSGSVVRELSGPHHPTELVESRRSTRALVGVDADSPYPSSPPSSADLRCDQREDNQALGGASLHRVLPPVRSRPERAAGQK